MDVVGDGMNNQYLCSLFDKVGYEKIISPSMTTV